MKQNLFPNGWNEERVQRVLDHYEDQSELEAVAEDEAAWEDRVQTFIQIPNQLLPTIREMIAECLEQNRKATGS